MTDVANYTWVGRSAVKFTWSSTLTRTLRFQDYTWNGTAIILHARHDQKSHGNWANAMPMPEISFARLRRLRVDDESDLNDRVRGMLINWTTTAAPWEEVQAVARSLVAGRSVEDAVDDFLEMKGISEDNENYARVRGIMLTNTESTKELLAAINSHAVSQKLYRGLSQVDVQREFKVGETFSESITSWTGKEELAANFAAGGYGFRPTPEGKERTSTGKVVMVLEGSEMHGLNVSKYVPASENKELREAQEYLTSGHYKVTSVTKKIYHHVLQPFKSKNPFEQMFEPKGFGDEEITFVTVTRIGNAVPDDLRLAEIELHAVHDQRTHGSWAHGNPADLPQGKYMVRSAVHDVDLHHMTRANHIYRGMTEEEFNATVARGTGVHSRQDLSGAGSGEQGTAFSATAADAESFIDNGTTDPRLTGRPTYIVEIAGHSGTKQHSSGTYTMRKGERMPASRISRVFKVTAVGNELVAEEIPGEKFRPLTRRKQIIERLKTVALTRVPEVIHALEPEIEMIEPTLDVGAASFAELIALYSEDQPREPAGTSEGGQFASVASGQVSGVTASAKKILKWMGDSEQAKAIQKAVDERFISVSTTKETQKGTAYYLTSSGLAVRATGDNLNVHPIISDMLYHPEGAEKTPEGELVDWQAPDEETEDERMADWDDAMNAGFIRYRERAGQAVFQGKINADELDSMAGLLWVKHGFKEVFIEDHEKGLVLRVTREQWEENHFKLGNLWRKLQRGKIKSDTSEEGDMIFAELKARFALYDEFRLHAVHDQSTHGNWADGGAVLELAKAKGYDIGDIRNSKPDAAYWVFADGTTISGQVTEDKEGRQKTITIDGKPETVWVPAGKPDTHSDIAATLGKTDEQMFTAGAIRFRRFVPNDAIYEGYELNGKQWDLINRDIAHRGYDAVSIDTKGFNGLISKAEFVAADYDVRKVIAKKQAERGIKMYPPKYKQTIPEFDPSFLQEAERIRLRESWGIKLHGQHDQSSHGNWADGNFSEAFARATKANPKIVIGTIDHIDPGMPYLVAPDGTTLGSKREAIGHEDLAKAAGFKATEGAGFTREAIKQGLMRMEETRTMRSFGLDGTFEVYNLTPAHAKNIDKLFASRNYDKVWIDIATEHQAYSVFHKPITRQEWDYAGKSIENVLIERQRLPRQMIPEFDPSFLQQAERKTLRDSERIRLHAQHDQSTHGSWAHGGGMAIANPRFREWFGKSKVRDESGQPLVVYHATSGDFNEFDMQKSESLGMHFGTPEQANVVAKIQRLTPGVNIMPVYLRLENPIVLSEDIGFTEPEPTVEALVAEGYMTKKEQESLRADFDKVENVPPPYDDVYADRRRQARMGALRKIEGILKRKGYDGIIYPNQFEVGELPDDPDNAPFPLSYAVFSPEQIKSATGNIGAFRRTARNIAAAEKITLHGDHDQKSHGNWATGGSDIAEEWLKRSAAIKTNIKAESESDKATIEYMKGIASMQEHPELTTEGYVLEHGERFTPQPLPKGIKRGTIKECFRNAALLAMDSDEYTYVEGIAHMGIIPMHHAWVVDKQGNVIDNTWRTPGLSYLGVKFPKKELMRRLAKQKTFGMLGYDSSIFNEAVDKLEKETKKK